MSPARYLISGLLLLATLSTPAWADDDGDANTLEWEEIRRQLTTLDGAAIDSLIYAGLGLLVVVGYYTLAWTFAGRNQSSGAIMPQSQPPDGISPAAARFLDRLRYDHAVLATAIMGLLARGVVTMDQTDHKLRLHHRPNPPTPDPTPMTADESLLLDELFDSGNTLAITPGNAIKVKAVSSTLQKSLRKTHVPQHFKPGTLWLIGGSALSLGVYAWLIFSQTPAMENLSIVAFMTVWLGVWTIGCVALVVSAVKAWAVVLTGRGVLQRFAGLGGAVFISAFSVPFLAGWVFGAGLLIGSAGLGVLLAMVGLIGVNFFFSRRLTRITSAGQTIRDQLEGMRQFITGGRHDRRVDRSRSPQEQAESLWPYAAALGVEDDWARQQRDTPGQGLPDWYLAGPGLDLPPNELYPAVRSALEAAIDQSYKHASSD